jgi:hypothetical protein
MTTIRLTERDVVRYSELYSRSHPMYRITWLSRGMMPAPLARPLALALLAFAEVRRTRLHDLALLQVSPFHSNLATCHEDAKCQSGGQHQIIKSYICIARQDDTLTNR